ncbi:MAG: cell surface protein SprA [Bacteroidia bacterium]|nr:cell surface protein SprA [Bacteroidia bacterium]
MSKISITVLLWAIGSIFYNPDGTQEQREEELPLAYHEEASLELWSPDQIAVEDTSKKKKKNPNNRVGDPTRQDRVTPLYLKNPRNFQQTFELNEEGGYNIYEKIGKINFRPPSTISFEDYLEYRRKKGVTDYFREQASSSNEENRGGLSLDINIDELSDVFGGGTISIRPTGYATLDFSIDNNKTENPSIPLRQQSTTTFNFDQQIQLGVIGQIGEKLKLNVNFDTQATFDFENELKLAHQGTEDQILQDIEAGNVNMQLGNSLIQGRQNLFGLKTRLRFGPVYVTAIASTERGKVESIAVAGGGAVETPFEKEAADYDANRHFFLSHYFRSRYEDALRTLPVISSTLRINRVEVWVQQQGATRNQRNAVGFVDLGENDNPVAGGQGRVYNEDLVQSTSVRLPDNESNNLFDLLTNSPAARQQSSAKSAIESLGVQMRNTEDFEILGNMRRLDQTEYQLNSQLGYISLNSPVPNGQVLFVAFDYTLNGQNFQVGEFGDDVPANPTNSDVIFVKMLRPSVLRVSPYPAWDLMMKNIYNIGYGLKSENFFLDIRYESGTSAGKINFLPTGAVANRQLIQVMGVDRLTNNTAPNPDNFFDYIEGVTVRSDRGLVIFPKLEPFGSHLANQLENDQNEVTKYVFQQLYDETQANAIQNFPELNRFTLEGYYRSAGGAEIPLNTFNLAEGSVTVTAGGQRLTENVDYQVDYFGGKVTIINQSILTSGREIKVDYESSSLYQVQTKTLLGARAEYAPNDRINFGLTAMNLREQPFNQKLTLGDEPTNNTLWGLDATYSGESDFLTKAIDRLPLITTKEKSNIDFAFEGAQFIPGVPKAIRNSQDRGVVYLEDFEAAATPFSLQGQQRWKLASFPDGNETLRNPAEIYMGDSLAENYTRAKLAWYQIDQTFYQGFGIEIPDEDRSNNYTRQVDPIELFPTSTRPFGQNLQLTFDLNYKPTERGPYNYQKDQQKLDANSGDFTSPTENWAGVMREIDVNNDFEATNVEFVEFWLMDPFMENPNHAGGEFYFNLGLIDEDVLPDQNLSRENGLPGPNDNPNVTPTPYGLVSIGNPSTNAFDNDPDKRQAQDIGLDGLNSVSEDTFFQDNFLGPLRNYLSPAAFSELQTDPSSDDFLHFRNEEYENRSAGILERYSEFNGMENNSPVQEQRTNFVTQATQQPDSEDLNENGSLNFAEQYWEYKIQLRPGSMVPGQNFIVDRIDSDANTPNGPVPVTWYQFRIPISTGRAVNDIADFKSINFMRMYLTDFEEDVILRMTEFQLIAAQWRRFAGDLRGDGIAPPPAEPPFASFDIGTVSVEENSSKQPFNYVLPPGIEQQSLNGNTNQGFLQDERSLTLNICDLEDGDGRAMFKTVTYDMRQYDRLRLFMHAEPVEDGVRPSNFNDRGDAVAFIRLGLDNDFNYYEYEIPLTPSIDGVQTRDNIWLLQNEFDFALSQFAVAKNDRNLAQTGLIYRHEYRDSTMEEGHKIYVKGTPKLSDVRNIMIGVRNPEDPTGERICLEVWVNELRLTNFDREKGYAANLNTTIQLADLGSISASGAFKTSGFGPLGQKISNRPLEDNYRYDLSANITLDKFFPKKWGLSLPVYATYGEHFINPQFNPQEADVRTDKLIEALDQESARAKLQEIQDYTRTRSISFNNWRKGKSQGRPGETGKPAKPPKSWPWDISNFDFTYAFNEQFSRNSVIQSRLNTQHRGMINYRYNFPQVQVQPFKNFDKLKFLHFINFSPVPTSVSVSIAGDRQFEARQMRPTSLFGGFVDTTFAKNFRLNRTYNLVWNFTRNLQFTYSANNVSRVDEVRGFWETASQRERDSVGTLIDNLIHLGRDRARGHNNLINMGRTTNFTHNFNIAYQLPFSQIRPLDWLNGTVNYSGTYNWQQAPETNPELGNTIGNSQNVQANARINLDGFYKKFKPIKTILEESKNKNQGRNLPQRQRPGQREEPKAPEADIAAEEDTVKKDPLKFLKVIGKEIVKLALSVKNVDLTYASNNGTILPGYLPQTDNFGIDWDYINPVTGQRGSILAPTAGFILGSQADIRTIAAENFWITQDTNLTSLYMQNQQDNLTGRASIELFPGFRIDVTANRSITQNGSEYFRWDPISQNYDNFDPLRNGSFSMSYIFIGTAFKEGLFTTGGEKSLAFDEFSQNRVAISQRLAAENPYIGQLDPRAGNEPLKGGFANGYPGTNQDVLIPSLLAAYGVYEADKISLSSLPRIPLPNWSLNYNVLTGFPDLKNTFNAIALKHTYRATYSIGTFNNNLKSLDPGGFGYSSAFDDLEPDDFGNVSNFYALDNYRIVQIQEQFSPLLGLTMTFKNGATASIDYKKGRQISFNVGNLVLTELQNQDIAVLFGWRKDKLNWNFTLGGKPVSLNNSLNISFRATLRDTRETNRFLTPSGTVDELASARNPETTRGAFNFILSPSIDYVVNSRLNVKLFFERNVNNPYVSNSFRTSFASGGFQLRFTLAQ